MQRNHCPQQCAQVHHQQLVIRARRKALRQPRITQIREEIERILQVVNDLVVHGQRARGHVKEVAVDVPQPKLESLQRCQLLAHTCRERGRRRVFNVPQEMLDADFFGFFGFDRGGDVQKCLACLRAVLHVSVR